MTTISRRRLATEVSFLLEGGALATGTTQEAATLYVQQSDSALAFGEGATLAMANLSISGARRSRFPATSARKA